MAVIGGGVAGLAATVALESCRFEVELFEAGAWLGGRTGAFQDSRTGQFVDRCQHVAMGCCSNLLDFCRRTGLEDSFARHKTLYFISPDNRRYDFTASRFLPSPLHLAPAVMALSYLSVAERIGIMAAMRRLLKMPAVSRGVAASRSAQSDETVGQWLRHNGQSEKAIKLFWSIVLESALSEKIEQVSLAAARKVFIDGFMASRDAYELLIPREPLVDLLDGRVGDYLAASGTEIHRRTRVAGIDGDSSRAVSLELADGTTRQFDAFVVAVPWHRLHRLLSPRQAAALPCLPGLKKIPSAAIAAVHLWHDRRITHLPHAVLLGRLSQWLFVGENGYSQVVISAAEDILTHLRDDVCQTVLAELQAVFPAAREAKLLDFRIVARPRAVFSCRPGIAALRPSQRTPIKNLALAGDWTDTGWPSTMEGAVRSGYLAAEALTQEFNNSGGGVRP